MLSGTSLCPPELDFFNQAPPEQNTSSGEDIEDEVIKPTKKKKPLPSSKPLPESVKALKKKYTEQRIARTVISQKMEKMEKMNKMANANSKKALQGKAATVKTVKKSNVPSSSKSNLTTSLRRGLRSSRVSRAAALKSLKSKPTVSTTRKRPSAAAIIAKRKTRMATLQASASSQASRMLTRLTPRGTSNEAFVKKAKKMQLDGKSLRGRDIDVSSDEEEGPARKMVCRKTASNVRRDDDSDDTSEEEEEEEEEESEEEEDDKEDEPIKKDLEQKKRPARKTKESATVFLNMIGQKLTKKSKDDDEISIESLTESTQGKRLEQAEKQKTVKDHTSSNKAKLITPPIIKKKKSKEDQSASKDQKDKASSSSSKDKKAKNILKEMQDRLLEEAKKKIASTPEAAPLVQPPKTETETAATNKSETSAAVTEADRITISQRTGYIQVKPRMSTDEEMPPQANAASITQRRLSDKSGGQRTSTPPRKILPKSSEPAEQQPQQQQQQQPPTHHLPVGVVGAAMTSSRPPAAQLVSTTPPRTVPLSQPLLINTCLAPASSSVAQIRPMVTAQPAPQPQPVHITQQGNIIMSRMPTMQMQPLQIRPGPQMQGMPIIMPTQIALANGSILQPVTAASQPIGARPSFYPTGQIMTSNVPMQMPPQSIHQEQIQQMSTQHQVNFNSA